MGFDVPGRSNSVQARHPDIEDHDVGPQALHRSDGLLSIGCLANQLDPRLHGEHSPQCPTRTRPIIGDKQATDTGLWAVCGRHAR